MNTMIFCTCWLGRVRGYVRWVKHHMQRFNSDNITFYIIDDGSPEHLLHELLSKCEVSSKLICLSSMDDFTLLKNLTEKLVIISIRPHLGRPGHTAYPGWWRSFLSSSLVASLNNYEKIIHIESDFYVISKKMTDYLMSLTSGWHTAWCKRHKFIETGIQVICKDALPSFENFKEKNFSNWKPLCKRTAEGIIKDFSTVFDMSFVGDRLGEFKHDILGPIDYYGQLTRENDVFADEMLSTLKLRFLTFC